MSRWLVWVVLAATACGDDGGAADAARLDAPVADARPAVDADSNVYLSDTGLYTDIAAKTLASDLIEVYPTYVLWSDGAVKRRWLRLPPGTTLDTSDMDHWELPVGGQLFKQFRAADGTYLETRLIERVATTGNANMDYWRGAFVWRADETDAVLAPDGAENVNGSQHDVPSQVNCDTCHGGEPGFTLGISLVQLSGAGKNTRVSDLVSMGLLSDPPAAEFVTPGDATTAAALGYLHANCGHCHNPMGAARPDVDLTLRLSAFDVAPETTEIWLDTVDQPLTRFMKQGYTMRIVSGDPDASGLLYRMTIRDGDAQMPALATEQVDDNGVAAVRAWIVSL